MGQCPTVTESGTINNDYITKWTSASGCVIGDSNIYSASGQVGIGTASPSQKLEVNGSVLVDNNLILTGSILSGSNYLLQYSNANANFSAGYQALNPSSTGTDNTAVGNQAL